jgi:hypothetical protein
MGPIPELRINPLVIDDRESPVGTAREKRENVHARHYGFEIGLHETVEGVERFLPLLTDVVRIRDDDRVLFTQHGFSPIPFSAAPNGFLPPVDIHPVFQLPDHPFCRLARVDDAKDILDLFQNDD